ncbi:protein of unknown function [Nitrospira japonica]|uniref:Uncharacterized protein n=1 Tax=Nitrospira japonica TaxID=1325564 RepID=A0A1W1I1C0_9BACT|nr:hypothetical protein [Nitrospira japonica]SLM46781.1 protein of unknown function [Nitrospira japonica]
MGNVAVVRKNYGEAELKLQGRIVYAWPNGIIEDGRDGSTGVAELAREANLASDILQQVVSQLGLLLTAAKGSEPIPADQVRVCLEEVLSELEESSTIHVLIQGACEAFNNAEPLPQVAARRKARANGVAA